MQRSRLNLFYIVAQLFIWLTVSQLTQSQQLSQTNTEILKQLPVKTIQQNSLFSVIDGALQAFMAQSADTLFVVDISSTLLAYKKSNGDLLWQAVINQSSVISTSPFYDAGSDSVYWVGQDEAIHSFDAATGDINWNTTVGFQQEQYNPVAANGVVGCIDYSIQKNTTMFIGYAATSGKILYQVPVGENYTVPQVYKGRAVFALNPWTSADSTARPHGSYLMSIDIGTGKTVLNQSVPYTITSPIYWVADDEVYFGASDGDQNTLLVRHDIRIANSTWRYNLSPNPKQYFKPALDSLPIVRDDFNMVYAPTRQGFLYGVDRTLGTQMWNVSQPNMTQPLSSSPVMIGYNIIIGSDKRNVFIINTNLTTVQTVIQTTEQVLNVLNDGDTLYYYDQSGTCGSTAVAADTSFYNIFQNIHPYFDMSDVTLAPAININVDNFTSDYAFDIYWNQSQIAIGFSKLYPMTVNKTEHLYWGATDYKLYDNANIQNYTQYNNFNRTFNSYIIAGPGINQDNDTIYVGSLDNSLYAVTATNEEVWTFATDGPILCDPYYINDTVYVASSDGYVYSINAIKSKGQNVTVNWQKSVGNWTISKPFIYQGLLYVATTGGDIYAIDTSNGVGQLIHTFPNIIYANGEVDYAGWLYFADKGGIIRRIGRDGTMDWEKTLDGAVLGGLTIVNNTVSVVTTGGTLYALDRLTGKQQWSYKNLGASFVAPVSYKETFYVGSIDGWVWAINSTDKTVLNSLQLDQNITSISTTENFARDKLLFVATSRVFRNNSMLAVDPTVNSTVYALQPPGATKKYTPQMYVGPIIPQPEDYLVGGAWPQVEVIGIDGVGVPAIAPGMAETRYQLESILYTRNCIACNQALGYDLGHWISQTMYKVGQFQSIYDQIQCPTSNTCQQAPSNGRRIKQQQYQMTVKQIFNTTGMKDPNSFKQVLSQQGNSIAGSSVMTNYYGATNYQLINAGNAPEDDRWTRHQKQIIPVIVVVGTTLLIILISWLFCCRLHKPKDPTVKARVADQGTFDHYRGSGDKNTQLNTRKPLLYSSKNDMDTKTRTQTRTPGLETSDIYEKDENEIQDYDDDSQERNESKNQKSK